MESELPGGSFESWSSISKSELTPGSTASASLRMLGFWKARMGIRALPSLFIIKYAVMSTLKNTEMV